MPTNAEIFELLQTKGKELSDWLRDNFDRAAAIVITANDVVIYEDLNKPLKGANKWIIASYQKSR